MDVATMEAALATARRLMRDDPALGAQAAARAAVRDHGGAGEDEIRRIVRALDAGGPARPDPVEESSKESFPASDPPSWTP